MLVAVYLILSSIFLIKTTISVSNFVPVDCKDNDFNKFCQCIYNNTKDTLIMTCNSTLEDSLHKLPLFSVVDVIVFNSYDHWPMIPVEYLNTYYLTLSYNKIESIGDLTHLDNLKFLNVSRNRISKIDKSLTMLKELIAIDLCYNLLEEIHFEDLVIDSDKDTFDPNRDQIFSKLKILLLVGNRIKQIYNLDLAFVGMPLLNMLAMDDNRLTSVEVNDLSQQSLNVIKKAKQAIQTNATYMDFISSISMTIYYFGFNINPITYVHFNFKAMLNEIFSPFKVNFMTRFLSISMEGASDKIICDCNIYMDFYFLIEQLEDTFGNDKIPDGARIVNFFCYKDSNSVVSMFTQISQNIGKWTDFCDSTSETWTDYKSSTTYAVSSKKSESTSTINATMKNSASHLKQSVFVKLIILDTLIYLLYYIDGMIIKFL